MSNKYKELFTPFKIGQVEIKNRFSMQPMGEVPQIDDDHAYTQSAIDYYVARAKGGVGLIVTGMNYVEYEIDKHEGLPMPCPTFNTQKYLKTARELTDRVHAFGTKIFLDLGIMPASGTYVTDAAGQDYSTEDMECLVKKTIEAARIAQMAGFDGCEIVCLIYDREQYNRNDKYGGDIRGRSKFEYEIVKGIKETCGESFAVIVRLKLKDFLKNEEGTEIAMPGEDFEEKGRTLETAGIIANILEEAGCDGFDGILGLSVNMLWSHPCMYFDQGYTIPYYDQMKKKISKPIIAGGHMENPDITLQGLKNGSFDFVGIGKQLLADPEYVNKVKLGRIDEIRPCLYCHDGCMNRWMYEYGFASCAVNPQAGREDRVPVLPALRKKKIVIVGGGPAGLEAAMIAAERGHGVTLFEKGDQLGGALLIGGQPEFKTADIRLAKWYDIQLRKLGVDVHLNEEATKEMLESSDADVLIFAEGSNPVKLRIPGVDDPKVAFAEDVLTGKKKAGDNCVIIGGGLVGCELALSLAKDGKNVTIVEALNDILQTGGKLSVYNEPLLRGLLNLNGVKLMTSSRLKCVTENGVEVETDDGLQNLAADSVILAVGYRSKRSLYEACADMDCEMYVAGDEKEVRNIRKAVWTGFEIARNI